MPKLEQDGYPGLSQCAGCWEKGTWALLPWEATLLLVLPVLPLPDEPGPDEEEVPAVVVPGLLGVLVSVLESGLLVLVPLVVGLSPLDEGDDGVLALSLSLSLSLSFDVEEVDGVEEDVSACTIIAAVEPLTINATINRKNPRLTENSAVFL